MLAVISRRINSWRKKKLRWPDRKGPPVSEEQERGWVPVWLS
jgi:hypothetical protein